MTASEIGGARLSDVEHRAQLRRALVASTVGTTIEWYDFLLYGQVTGLVFGKLFFPQSDPLVGVLQAFAIFFVGFVGRPIGAAIFGHWGDRIGRKATLIATLLVTGLATVAVGLVPTYASIGIWGAVLLTVIRLIQGIGVGGEWGGSVLLAMEWARTNKHRGFIAVLAAIRRAGRAVPGESGGAVLQLVFRRPVPGLGLAHSVPSQHRHGRDRAVDPARHPRNPGLPEGDRRRTRRTRAGLEVLKRQPKQVALTALLRMPEQAPGYIVGAFIFTYGTTVLGASRDFLLIGRPRPGRPRVSLGPGRRASVRPHRPQAHVYDRLRAHVGIFGFIYFALLDTKVPALIFLAIALSLLPVMTLYGPQAALIAESFSPRLRYSGASLGYQLASIIAGGPSPFIATALFAAFHSSLPIALYILGCARSSASSRRRC